MPSCAWNTYQIFYFSGRVPFKSNSRVSSYSPRLFFSIPYMSFSLARHSNITRPGVPFDPFSTSSFVYSFNVRHHMCKSIRFWASCNPRQICALDLYFANPPTRLFLSFFLSIQLLFCLLFLFVYMLHLTYRVLRGYKGTSGRKKGAQEKGKASKYPWRQNKQNNNPIASYKVRSASLERVSCPHTPPIRFLFPCLPFCFVLVYGPFDSLHLGLSTLKLSPAPPKAHQTFQQTKPQAKMSLLNFKQTQLNPSLALLSHQISARRTNKMVTTSFTEYKRTKKMCLDPSVPEIRARPSLSGLPFFSSYPRDTPTGIQSPAAFFCLLLPIPHSYYCHFM